MAKGDLEEAQVKLEKAEGNKIMFSWKNYKGSINS